MLSIIFKFQVFFFSQSRARNQPPSHSHALAGSKQHDPVQCSAVQLYGIHFQPYSRPDPNSSHVSSPFLRAVI